MQMSSAMLAVWGKSSLSWAPLWPWRANLKMDGATGKLFWPEVIVVMRWPMRTESGSSIPRRAQNRWLVIEEVDLRRGAGLEEVDDPLDSRREMGKAGKAGIGIGGLRCGAISWAIVGHRVAVAAEQRAQGHRAQAESRAFQEDAAV